MNLSKARDNSTWAVSWFAELTVTPLSSPSFPLTLSPACPSKKPLCRFKTSPCVPAPRPHVVTHMRVAYARGAGTHGDVLNLHTEVFSACQAAPHTTPHNTTSIFSSKVQNLTVFFNSLHDSNSIFRAAGINLGTFSARTVSSGAAVKTTTYANLLAGPKMCSGVNQPTRVHRRLNVPSAVPSWRSPRRILSSSIWVTIPSTHSRAPSLLTQMRLGPW